MGRPRLSSCQIAERGKALFDRAIRDSLGPSADGKYLVLEIESGDYEHDFDEIFAVKRIREKHPTGDFYMLRVGHRATYRLGSRAGAGVACR